jgi:hypothetical protein
MSTTLSVFWQTPLKRTTYEGALDLLDKYDHQQLQIPAGISYKVSFLTYQGAKKQIEIWRHAQKADQTFWQ